MPSDTILFYEDYEQERPRRLTVPPRTDYMGYIQIMWDVYQDGDLPGIPSSAFNHSVRAFVNHGRWVWQCEVCDSAYPVSRPALFSLCVVCGTDWMRVELPENDGDIDDLLLSMPGHRYNAPVRNWHPEWPPEMLAERARIAVEKQKAKKGTLVGLSIRATRTWLVGEILSATNMNTFVSGTDDDLAGRNGPVEFENSIEVNDGNGRYIELPTGTPPTAPRAGMMHNLSGQNRPAFFSNAWNAISYLTDVTFARLMANGSVGAGATQVIKGDHDHTGSDEGVAIPEGGLEPNSVRLQELAHGMGGRVLGFDSTGAPAQVRTNRVVWDGLGATPTDGERVDDARIVTQAFKVRDSNLDFDLTNLVVSRDIAASPTRLYNLTAANPNNQIQVWDFEGTRQTSEEFSLVGNAYQGIAVIGNRLYALWASGTRQIRVWDLDGNRQSSEDFDIPSFIYDGLTNSANRLYILNRGRNPDSIDSYTISGTEQTTERVSIPTSIPLASGDAVEEIGGYFYILDASGRDVFVLNPAGVEQESLELQNFATSSTFEGIASTPGRSFITNASSRVWGFGDGVHSVNRWDGSAWQQYLV